ncbi:MAG: hypothetical protein RSE22_01535, partial [Mucinivorans sp.]
MPKLFSSQSKKFLMQIDKPEKDLNQFICDNWLSLFPHLKLVASEFSLAGNVREIDKSGRIDILAYNPSTRKFVVFELKKDYDRNITQQASDYLDFVQENFEKVYLGAYQTYKCDLPEFTQVIRDQVEIVLIAKRFNPTHIERVKKSKGNNITLIKYYWFEDNLIFIDYINNDPDAVNIESINAKKINKIKQIVDQDPDYSAIEQYFGLKPEAKIAFTYFYEFLKKLTNIAIEAQQSKMKVTTSNTSFSVIGMGGKTGRKAILQINTNIDVLAHQKLDNIIIEDRYRGEGQKKKGSLGSERYELYIRSQDEMQQFCAFLEESSLI